MRASQDFRIQEVRAQVDSLAHPVLTQPLLLPHLNLRWWLCRTKIPIRWVRADELCFHKELLQATKKFKILISTWQTICSLSHRFQLSKSSNTNTAWRKILIQLFTQPQPLNLYLLKVKALSTSDSVREVVLWRSSHHRISSSNYSRNFFLRKLQAVRVRHLNQFLSLNLLKI